MCKRKSARGSCGKFQYESPLRILGRGKGAEEKEKRNTEKNSSYKEFFSIEN